MKSIKLKSHPNSAFNSYEAKMQSLIAKEDYKSEVTINKSFGHYQIKLAENLEELCEAFALRHEVFFKEKGDLLQQENSNAAMDLDEFDLIADHLILKDSSTNKVVGTYRLLDSDRTGHFYSETEFNIKPILALAGKKLELGRACIHPDYRTGTCIALVWQGIGEYMKQSGAKWAFGCSSVPIDEVNVLHLIGAKLIKDHIVDYDLRVTPLKPAVREELNFEKELSGNFKSLDDVKNPKLPPLLKGYLKLGAKICGVPCWDEEFKTLDFLTLLSIENMNPQFSKRFGVSD